MMIKVLTQSHIMHLAIKIQRPVTFVLQLTLYSATKKYKFVMFIFL